MIAYAAKGAVPDEDLDRRLALHVGVLDTDEAGGPEQPGRGVGDYPDRVQPILPREQGEQRVMITDLGRTEAYASSGM